MNTATHAQTAHFVPFIIGRGKLAQHLIHAFRAHRMPFQHSADARNIKDDPTLLLKLTCSSHVWILTKDDAIQGIVDFIKSMKDDVKFIHSAGALHIPGTTTLHPLMTFAEGMYDPAIYWNLPWISFSNEPEIQAPFLNQRITLSADDRTRYHAACVMISNFSNLLWTGGANLVPSLSREHFLPILTTTLQNFVLAGKDALTGPLKRGDVITVDKHMTALAKLPEQKLYESFTTYYGERDHDHRS